MNIEKMKDQQKQAFEHEWATFWQGMVMWALLIIGVTLILVLSFLTVDFLEQKLAPTFDYHLIVALITATFISAVAIVLFRKSFF